MPLEMVKDLAAMLEDDDPLQVAAAARAIGVLAHHHEEYPFSEAIPGLVRALRIWETGKEIPVAVEQFVRQRRVESATIDAIGAMGNRAREAVPALLAALDRRVAAEAAMALATMHLSKSEILELVAALGSPDKYCRRSTAEALASFPEHKDIFPGPLTSVLADGDGEVVECALLSMDALLPAERSVALRAIDLIPRDDVRTAAFEVLARNRSGAPERIEALARALRDPELAGAALEAFEFTEAPIPQEILPALLDVCRGEDRDLRWRALSLIRGAGKAAQGHVRVLREIFGREADEDLRRDAGDILAEIESAR